MLRSEAKLSGPFGGEWFSGVIMTLAKTKRVSFRRFHNLVATTCPKQKYLQNQPTSATVVQAVAHHCVLYRQASVFLRLCLIATLGRVSTLQKRPRSPPLPRRPQCSAKTGIVDVADHPQSSPWKTKPASPLLREDKTKRGRTRETQPGVEVGRRVVGW